MKGRLEHEIRLLPQVLSCSFSADDDVVVLIDPSADPWAVQVSVERILATAGTVATVRIVGPAALTRPARLRPISPLVATATVGTVAAVGLGALFGGLIAVQHPQPAPLQHSKTIPAAAAPFDSLDVLRGLQGVAEQAGLPAPAATPVERPDGLPPLFQVSAAAPGPQAVEKAPHQTQTHVQPTGSAEVEERGVLANRRGAPRARHGKHLGVGPRPWSESVLLPPHPPGDAASKTEG
ncbi:MAG: hypothetical protein ACXVQY_00665 [Actinomycetota bacterium]